MTLWNEPNDPLTWHHIYLCYIYILHLEQKEIIPYPECMLSCFSPVWLFVTLLTVPHQAPLSMDSPGKNTGMVCHALLQGIFPTQGSNLHSCCTKPHTQNVTILKFLIILSLNLTNEGWWNNGAQTGALDIYLPAHTASLPCWEQLSSAGSLPQT